MKIKLHSLLTYSSFCAVFWCWKDHLFMFKCITVFSNLVFRLDMPKDFTM